MAIESTRSGGEVRISRSLADLDGFREETRRNSRFACKLVALADQDDWAIREGVLSHRSRGFFHVAGAVHDGTGEERLVLHQPQAAITCLAIHVEAGRVHVLTQARPEPGNCEEVQFGPTIQSTPANYLRLHGGRPTLHLDCFIDCVPEKARPLAQSSQLDLGHRYFQKIKTLMYVEAPEWLETGHDLAWVPLDVLAEGLERDHFLNIDFRSLLACFDWDAWLGPRATDPADRDGDGRGIVLPGSERRSGALLSSPAKPGWRLERLDRLVGWRETTHGVEARGAGDASVRLYQAVCEGREKSAWFQPLFEIAGTGQVDLYVRRPAGRGWEFLLTRVEDPGIAASAAWTTTVDRAPEQTVDPRDPRLESDEPVMLRGMTLSEEGGRFLRNANRYEIRLARDGLEAGPGRSWVDLEGLRQILQSSNEATIHLRCIASLVLDWLYPQTFGAGSSGRSSRS